MRKTFALLVLAALAMTACGSSGTRTVVQTITAKTPATTPETADADEQAAESEEPAADENDCVTLGMGPDGDAEGRCVSEGQKFAFVNRGTELRLKTIAVRVDGISFSDTVSSDISTETASGTFATISLTVRNRSDTPQTFAGGFARQTMLIIGRRQFNEDFDVENGADQQSFSWQGDEIQPGGEQRGHIVFDIPKRVASRIEREGNLLVVDFGVDLSYDDEAPEVGAIRLRR